MILRIRIFILVVILAVGFAVRMYKIDNPIADWHSWRQADTAAVTRNFVRYGVNLLYPRYDDFSDVSGRGLFNPEGYRMVEFPLFNLVHYTLREVFPFNTLEFWGRMTSVLSALASAVFIYLIVSRHASEKTAMLASFFYLLLPFNIYFTRVILPDPFMVTLYLVSLYFLDLWSVGSIFKFFLLSAFFGALAVMVKPVAIFFLGVPAAWLFWKKYGFRFYRQKPLIILYSLYLVPFLVWRTWEHRHPEGIPGSIWLLNGDHIRFKGAFFRWIFGERLGNMILGNWGILPLSAGIIAALSSGSYLLSWLAGAVLYLFTFASGNVRHDYYQIPILPAVSVMLALGVTALWKAEPSLLGTLGKRTLALISVLFMLSFSWYTLRGNYQINHWEIIQAGRAVDRLIPGDATVIANYNGDTAFLYHTNRRGFTNVPLPVKDLIDRFGIDYYVSVNYDVATRDIMDIYTVVEEKPEYVIVRLEERPRHLLTPTPPPGLL